MRSLHRHPHNQVVETKSLAAGARVLPLRPQDELECRRCGVHCDKVVYPASCLARSCPYVYSYEAYGHTYMGCMRKIYEVEIDLDLVRRAERGRDGFGAVSAKRAPLPICRVEVESTYASRSGELGCVNPEFFELPVGEPTFRVFAEISA